MNRHPHTPPALIKAVMVVGILLIPGRPAPADFIFSEPVNIGPLVNTWHGDSGSCISADALSLYFTSNRPGGLGERDIWQSIIDPVMDFDGDGLLDLTDMVMLIDHWETDDSLFDIGPMPWGDGVVDVLDLKVFIEYWEKK